MKVLGHIYVAIKAFPKRNHQLLAWGAILPEMMFYVKENPFEYRQIHEGGEKIVEFLRTRKPEWIDLGLGIIAHSQKKGADFFDSPKKLRQLGYFQGEDTEFEEKIVEALNLPNIKTAQSRAHNILDLALDLYIGQKYPWVMGELTNALTKIPVLEMANILSECFTKPRNQVEIALQKLKEMINLEDLNTAKGLARLWTRFSEALPEKEINTTKTAEAINLAAKIIQGKQEAFLRSAVERTRRSINRSFPCLKERLF